MPKKSANNGNTMTKTLTKKMDPIHQTRKVNKLNNNPQPAPVQKHEHKGFFSKVFSIFTKKKTVSKPSAPMKKEVKKLTQQKAKEIAYGDKQQRKLSAQAKQLENNIKDLQTKLAKAQKTAKIGKSFGVREMAKNNAKTYEGQIKLLKKKQKELTGALMDGINKKTDTMVDYAEQRYNMEHQKTNAVKQEDVKQEEKKEQKNSFLDDFVIVEKPVTKEVKENHQPDPDGNDIMSDEEMKEQLGEKKSVHKTEAELDKELNGLEDELNVQNANAQKQYEDNGWTFVENKNAFAKKADELDDYVKSEFDQLVKENEQQSEKKYTNDRTPMGDEVKEEKKYTNTPTGEVNKEAAPVMKSKRMNVPEIDDMPELEAEFESMVQEMDKKEMNKKMNVPDIDDMPELEAEFESMVQEMDKKEMNKKMNVPDIDDMPGLEDEFENMVKELDKEADYKHI